MVNRPIILFQDIIIVIGTYTISKLIEKVSWNKSPTRLTIRNFIPTNLSTNILF